MNAWNLKRIVWLAVFFGTLIWSAIEPKEYFTWSLEVAPAIIGIVIMAWTARRVPLTDLLYVLILLHCIVLMIGGHYTYAEVPFFDGLFGSTRNNYDKVGHFMQGFVPAILCREILIRNNVVNGRWWRSFFIVSICLAFSAFYELVEWAVAVSTGDSAEAFLGTQGYVWDTQSDMGLALLGAIVALFALSRLHDSRLKSLLTHHDAKVNFPESVETTNN